MKQQQSFDKFLEEAKQREFLLSEMPWISVGDKGYDLELEVSPDSNKDFINLMRSWLTSKPIKSKRNISVTLPKDKVGEFSKQLLNYDLFEKMVAKKYGAETWEAVKKLLLSKASSHS